MAFPSPLLCSLYRISSLTLVLYPLPLAHITSLIFPVSPPLSPISPIHPYSTQGKTPSSRKLKLESAPVVRVSRPGCVCTCLLVIDLSIAYLCSPLLLRSIYGQVIPLLRGMELGFICKACTKTLFVTSNIGTQASSPLCISLTRPLMSPFPSYFLPLPSNLSFPSCSNASSWL